MIENSKLSHYKI